MNTPRTDAMQALDAVQKRLSEYEWLLDCAKKTGVTVTFKDDVMQIIHGAFHDELAKARRRLQAVVDAWEREAFVELDDEIHLTAIYLKGGI